MSKIGKRKPLKSGASKKIPSHGFFYPNEYKEPPKPGGYLTMLPR
jgi:hypothetical protein